MGEEREYGKYLYLCKDGLNYYLVVAIDPEQFNILIRTTRPGFLRFAYSYVRDENVAEDLVNEAMISLWEARLRLPDDANIKAYYLTSLKNKCIDYLRRQHTIKTAVSDINNIYSWDLTTRIASLECLNPEEVFSKEIMEIVAQTLRGLPSQTKTIFEMSRYHHKSNKEISELMSISEKSVEYHISKVLRQLRKKLADYIPEAGIILLLNSFLS